MIDQKLAFKVELLHEEMALRGNEAVAQHKEAMAEIEKARARLAAEERALSDGAALPDHRKTRGVHFQSDRHPHETSDVKCSNGDGNPFDPNNSRDWYNSPESTNDSGSAYESSLEHSNCSIASDDKHLPIHSEWSRASLCKSQMTSDRSLGVLGSQSSSEFA